MALDVPRLRQCAGCAGILPAGQGPRLCPACLPDPEMRFRLLRDYLRDHQGASVMQVARDTGLSASDVTRFIDSGRLRGAGGS